MEDGTLKMRLELEPGLKAATFKTLRCAKGMVRRRYLTWCESSFFCCKHGPHFPPRRARKGIRKGTHTQCLFAHRPRRGRPRGGRVPRGALESGGWSVGAPARRAVNRRVCRGS